MSTTRTSLAFAVLLAGALAGCESSSQSCFVEGLRRAAIAGVEEGITGTEVEVQNPCLASGSEPESATQTNQPSQDDLAARYGQKYAELIREGRIDYGMSEEEVLLAWGEPVSKKSQGKSKDIWNYGDDRVVFTKGTVSAVNH